MRILPRPQREAMFEIYAFCRAVDDIADDPGPRQERLETLRKWRNDIQALYAGPRDAVPLLRPRRLRGRAPVGAGLRNGAKGRSRARASSGPSAAIDQYSAGPRRGCWARLPLSAARGTASGRNRDDRSDHGPGVSDDRGALRCNGRARTNRIPESERDHGRGATPPSAGAAHHGPSLSAYSGSARRARLRAAANAGAPSARENSLHRSAQSRV